MTKCPGQDQRFWKPEDIFEVECAKCGKPVEFFKDEPQLKCRGCGYIIVNPRIDLGCAEWCQYAAHCLGAKLSTMTVIRQKLIDEAKEAFGPDKERFDNALAVLSYAEKIQAVEGGDPLVVKAAAILHDIGSHGAKQEFGYSKAEHQEAESPPIAEGILKRHDIPAETIERILNVIAEYHGRRDIGTIESHILWDADQLVHIPNDCPTADGRELGEIINRRFRTSEGHRIAAELFLKG
ncbi:MAG: HD domain-containing protein [Sedimentisphaerales bacterium]|jgi:DNA-directed RNA polymerase subunit RPC12/RpoP